MNPRMSEQSNSACQGNFLLSSWMHANMNFSEYGYLVVMTSSKREGVKRGDWGAGGEKDKSCKKT